ncbi:MAG: hypothetical protein R3B72_49185 [Polyangiaceae bacterium]
MGLVSATVGVVIHAIAAPLFFVGIARQSFGARGARDSGSTAVGFTLVVAVLDGVAGVVLGRVAMLASFAGMWLPLAVGFLATWATGALMATMPWKAPEGAAPHEDGVRSST